MRSGGTVNSSGLETGRLISSFLKAPVDLSFFQPRPQMCLLGQISDAQLGHSQDCASRLDLTVGCRCGSGLHAALGICFFGVIAWPSSHSLNNVKKTLDTLRGVGRVEAFSLFCSFSIGHSKSLGQATRPWAEAFAPHRLQHHNTMEL